MLDTLHPLLRDEHEENPENADMFAATFAKYKFASLIFGPAVSAFWIFYARDKVSFMYWQTAWEGNLYFWWPVFAAS